MKQNERVVSWKKRHGKVLVISEKLKVLLWRTANKKSDVLVEVQKKEESRNTQQELLSNLFL